MLNFYSSGRALCAGLLAFGLSACGTLSQQQIDPPDSIQQPVDSISLRDQVDALAQPLVEGKRTPGIVVGVLSADGRTQVFGYGVSDTLGSATPDGDTLFAVGSLSKGFVGNLAAMLVQEGLLNWDDSLEQLLPAGTPLSEDARPITLLQLATHTGGLPRQPMTPRTLSYFIEYLFTGNSFYRHFDQTYLLDYLADFSKPRKVVPQYSNIGYALLAHVLELRSGKSIDELTAERILGPLQLDNTSYQPQQLVGYGRRARGHAGDQPKFIRRGRPVPDWQFSDILHGTAALYSNANDLLDYAAAHLHGSGDAQRDAAFRDSLRVRLERPREAPAIAWIVDDIHGQRITYQVGLVAGYSSYLGLDRHHKTAVVVLQNSFNWSDSIGHRLLLRMAHSLDKQQALASAPRPYGRQRRTRLRHVHPTKAH